MKEKTAEDLKTLIIRCIEESYTFPTKREIIDFAKIYDFSETEIVGEILNLLRTNDIYKNADDTYMTVNLK